MCLSELNSWLFCRLREYEANSLKKDHLELWLLLHVWSFIDKAFENLGDVEAVR